MESFPKLKRQYTITMLEKHEDYAVFDVDVLLISGDRETTAKHRVYLTIRPWEGMEEILGENPFTVQHEGKSNALKQLNSGTYAFSKFFGLCHCDILIGLRTIVGFITQPITGLWSRAIKRLSDNKEVKFIEVVLKEQDIERLKALRVGDTLQIWENEHRKNNDSPTHNMRLRREDKT